MSNPQSARTALTAVAVICGIVGVITVAIALLTWPQYDSLSAEAAARSAAAALDMPFNPAYVSGPPSTTGHLIAVVVGGILILLAVFTLIMRLVVAANSPAVPTSAEKAAA